MTKVLVFLLAALASASCASNRKIVASAPSVVRAHDLSYENVEFPPYDQNIWRRQRPGVIAKAAAATAHTPFAPERPGLLAENGQFDESLQSLGELVEQYPQSIEKAFELLTPQLYRFNDQVYPERRARLQQIAIAARRQAATLPREDAARAIRHVMFVEAMFFPSGQYEKELDRQRQTFLQEYRGTEAALDLEVEMIRRRGDILTGIANLRKFAADHSGTTVGARALYQAGFQLAVNVGTSGRIPKGTDPTERILQVVQIMNELESGRYPRCEWVEKAPSLVIGLFAGSPSYAPQNIETLLVVYQRLLDRIPPLVTQEDVNFAVGILGRMAELYALKGTEDAIDTVVANLDRRRGHSGLGSYLKAMLYIGSMNDQRRAEKPVLLKKVIEALIRVQENGTGMYQRRSLAILASVYFAERDFATARDAYRRYIQKYPESPWSWVAAFRLGQTLDELRDARAAVDVYRDIAVDHRDNAVARTLGSVQAARSLESLSRFDEALVEYERALRGWDPDFGPRYSASMSFGAIPREILIEDVAREQVEQRALQLRGSQTVVGGDLLERGRWLIEHERPTEALVPLEEMLRAARDRRAADEARRLIHLARLRRALYWAAAAPTPDIPAALAELDLIARDEPDSVTFAANIAKASILWRQNASSEAEAVMHETLVGWQSHPTTTAGPVAAIRGDAIRGDVAAIRNLLFQFDDEPVYGQWARGRHARRSSPAPFIVVNPDIRVKLFDGTERLESVFEGLVVKQRVLFLSEAEISLLRDIHTRLEGEFSGKPSPTQQFWSRFFPVRVSQGATLVLQSAPIIQDIEFLDAARTRAAARVAIDSEGTTVIFEKDNAGIWKAVRRTNTWIA